MKRYWVVIAFSVAVAAGAKDLECLLVEDAILIPNRQSAALNVVLRSGRLPADSVLQREIEDKRRQIHTPPDDAFEGLGPELRYQRSLELILRTFDNQFGSDLALREAVIQELAKSPHSDASTIALLSRIARGIDAKRPEETRMANEAILKIAQRGNLPDIQPLVTRGVNGGRPPVELQALAGAKIKEIKKLGEGTSGVNGTYIITFENGRKAIFKPAQGEEFYNRPNPTEYVSQMSFTREPDAARFFRGYFQKASVIDTPTGPVKFHVPEAMEVVLNASLPDGNGRKGGVGSLQLFEEGYQTLNEAYGPYEGKPKVTEWQKFDEVWRRAARDPNWRMIASWTQTFDYANGNFDRLPNSLFNAGNPNNLMVKRDKAGNITDVLLIDNAKGRFTGSGFTMADPRNVPDPNSMPEPLRKALQTFDTEQYHAQNRDLMPDDSTKDVQRRMDELRNLATNGKST